MLGNHLKRIENMFWVKNSKFLFFQKIRFFSSLDEGDLAFSRSSPALLNHLSMELLTDLQSIRSCLWFLQVPSWYSLYFLIYETSNLVEQHEIGVFLPEIAFLRASCSVVSLLIQELVMISQTMCRCLAPLMDMPWYLPYFLIYGASNLVPDAEIGPQKNLRSKKIFSPQMLGNHLKRIENMFWVKNSKFLFFQKNWFFFEPGWGWSCVLDKFPSAPQSLEYKTTHWFAIYT